MYDTCDKNLPTVIANSSNHSWAGVTIYNACKQHVHSKCHILSLKSKYLET